VGHGGTLDPAVTGVLPLALGPATRLLPYLNGTKRYEGVIQLGVSTSTDDLEGTVLSTAPVPTLTTPVLDALLEPFRGEILQRPPQVSAVHVQGERAYARARRGETLELEARPVTVETLELLHWDPDQQRLHLAVTCSAGTYIRSLARDLGEHLGCGGSLASLRRAVTPARPFQLGHLRVAPRQCLEWCRPNAFSTPVHKLGNALDVQRLLGFHHCSGVR
jgi:tRNA pseudouridine55 synthase